MKINKSSRHAKITGDFAESLVLYWLSKYGFECAMVDHTGIDIIATNPHNNERMGLSVKARSREDGKEGDSILIKNDNFPKALAACDAFGCVPYFAIVVDQGDEILAFITSLDHLLELFPKTRNASNWKMSPKYLAQFAQDPQIKTFKFKHDTTRWW